MYRLYDERDRSFEIVTENLEPIARYLGDDYAECEDWLDIDCRLVEEQEGIAGYRAEKIESEDC